MREPAAVQVTVAQLRLVRRMERELELWGRTIAFGLLSAAVIALVHFTLARRIRPWGRAVLFGALSAAVVALIYALPPYEYAGIAGANFDYNVSFFFPALVSSFLFWLAALTLYVRFLRRQVSRSPSKIILPPLLLLPFVLQVSWMIALVVVVESSV